ncbi:MAG: signal recognition particle-docking protein FtsY [Nitrospirae bacterium CG18_big_fil_WC_8_21_14_2_50_70_55]|nr:signal recognition particle-docking protein FtsY [Deltaproteobacteria bacterium]OIP61939.1 MAG: signal recognition particle-docking protein FtsY [Nitrospirae bacterium CG2_30_70_394]PIQ06934.1 MAG: signal recognition particle-docking protein FtsY [Nitrospirae bacterium CG18_big_fil_WC_8_21_14_2_50_70_55]PIU79168.1 MAG: signal recognition particle-docking protein FtsY [Nitrospirae bacterium CG06_land_8_20_14_3_00_70_43]PIW82102.1 MAG: signal recognition particle-docking protein FtsY [Nitrospi
MALFWRKRKPDEAATEAAALPAREPEGEATPAGVGAGAGAPAAEGVATEPAPLATEDAVAPVAKAEGHGLFARLRRVLGRGLGGRLAALLGRRRIDEALLEELETLLISSDLGVDTSLEILEAVRERASRDELKEATAIRELIRDHLTATLEAVAAPLVVVAEPGPAVVIVIGVNGSGKTTTIGKLAFRLVREGKGVVIAAADTYRAAAAEQLAIWGERAGCAVVRKEAGADPAAVVYDALARAKQDKAEVVIVDTAGRLHTETNLMEELAKIARVASRQVPDAPHEVLLVLDATTGQNAVQQAELFHRYTGLTGLVLTKLDGTAKGGIVVGITHRLGVPVKLIGIGEGVEDLRDFDPAAFVDALLAG